MYGARRDPWYRGLTQTVAPAAEPVSLGEARLFCRIDSDQTDEDALVLSLVTAARQHVEKLLGQCLVTQTWKLILDRFPGWEIELPLPPLQSIASVSYVDPDGVTQTMSSALYLVDVAGSRPGRLTPIWSGYWPATRYQNGAVQITFVAGYGAASAVPEAIKQIVKLLVGHWYANREAVVTGTTPNDLKMAVDALAFGQWQGTY